MRTLKFIVDGLIVKQDPNCDFTNLVKGTEGYLQAEFLFSQEWNGCAKVVEFRNPNTHKEFTPQLLDKKNTCMIASDVLSNRSFELKLLGKKPGFKLSTNYVKVVQNGG